MRGIATILAATVLIFSSPVAASAPAQRQNNVTPQPWVTVDANGATKTVTPTVNAGTTVSPFPGSVPVPTADAKGSGAFIACTNLTGSEGPYAPFCAPKSGSDLYATKAYFVTWDPKFFEDHNLILQIEGETTVSEGFGGRDGFVIPNIRASNGFYAWTPDDSSLPASPVVDVQLYLSYAFPNGSAKDRDPGPRVRIIRGPESGQRATRRALTIALPLVFGLLALAGIAGYVWWRRKRNGMTSGRRGYGVRKSRIQRVGTDIKLSDGTFSTSSRELEPQPSGNGGNVFREELRRQDRER